MGLTANLPWWERAARLVGGGAMIAAGAIWMDGGWASYLLAGGGVIALLTGLVGFCPACALAGRGRAKP